MGAKVFISYSSKEMEIAGRVCEQLEEHNIPCWIAPRNINPGENYATQIVQAIRGCSILVLLASESTNASGHVSNEVSLAFDSKKVIIPFKLEDVVFSDEYLYFLGRKHWIEAHKDMKAGLEQLLVTVQHLLNSVPNQNQTPVKANIESSEKATKAQEHAFDKAQELAQTEYSREAIVNRILDRAGKYSNSFISKFEKGDNFERLKTLANGFFKQSIHTFRYNKPKAVDNCVDYLVDELLSDDDAEVIKISGLPGSAKSILMQASFYKAIMAFQNNESKYLPFYISLGYFEKARYSAESAAEQVKALMTKEMVEFLSYTKKNPQVIPILFVDEVREHIVGKIALENVLMEILEKEKIYKRVVAIDCGLIRNKSRLKRVIPIVSERVSALFETHKIDSHDELQAKKFIQYVIEFFDCDVTVEEVFTTIKKLKYQEIDVFIVRSLAGEIMSSPDEIVSISDMYEKWALTELYGDEEKLLTIADAVAHYLFKSDFSLESLNFNDPQWALLHNHQTYLDLLISYHFIKKAEKYEGQKDFDCGYFNIMLTSSTDMFIGSFLRDNYALQEKIFRIVTDYYDTFEIVQKSSATFWLAKLSYKNLVADAAAFIKEKYEALKPIVKSHDNTAQTNYDNQFYFRALSFTLIVFGQTGILDDYLCLLITNDSANAINRGAIIEYYSDQYQMAANESYYLDTNVKIGNRAIKALTWKMNYSLLHGTTEYPEINMLTLSTLLQMRIQSNESRYLPEIRSWVSDMIAGIQTYRQRPRNVKSEKIEFYFSSVYDDFTLFLDTDGSFDISQIIYNTLRNLKNVKRQQWVDKEIEDPESISEHSYSAWMLAMLFLPEELNYDDYSKKEVLDMLLIHDMAEAKIGDQVLNLNEPYKELREQNVIMRKLMIKGSYPNIANLTYYYNVWTGYYNGTNTNSKIARDINLIQSVYTFCEYFAKSPEKFTMGDKRKWISEKGKLETDIGYAIFEKLVEKNLDFSRVFDEMI